MRATMPEVVVPGDNEEQIDETRPHLMARNGTCMGMSDTRAVWRFGQLQLSEAAQAYGIYIAISEPGFMWVLAERTTGDEIQRFFGAAMNLPKSFRQVLDWND